MKLMAAVIVLIAVSCRAGVPTTQRALENATWEFWDKEHKHPKDVQILDSAGRQHGEWITWHQNGTMSSKSSFHHGELLLVEMWWDNGEKRMQEPMAEGLPHSRDRSIPSPALRSLVPDEQL